MTYRLQFLGLATMLSVFGGLSACSSAGAQQLRSLAERLDALETKIDLPAQEVETLGEAVNQQALLSAKPPAQIKVFSLRNEDAVSVARTAAQLFVQDRALRLSADSRTNSVIACGTAGDMELLQALLMRLDGPAADAPKPATR